MSFSQSTYRDSILISKDQLKKTNLIFNDRDRVISLNKNLSEQIVYYNSLLEIQSKKDSLYSLKINNLDSIVNYQDRIIIQKDKKIKNGGLEDVILHGSVFVFDGKLTPCFLNDIVESR